MASPEEMETLKKIQERFVLKIGELPDTIDTDQYSKKILEMLKYLSEPSIKSVIFDYIVPENVLETICSK